MNLQNDRTVKLKICEVYLNELIHLQNDEFELTLNEGHANDFVII